jgi:hypothetical protein
MTFSVVSMGNLSTGTTLTNTTTETVLRSFSIPSHLFTSGRGMRWNLAGRIVGADSTNPTVIFRTRIKAATSTGLGTLVMETTAITLATSTSARAWGIDGGIIAETTADQRHWADLRIGAAGVGIRNTTKNLVGIGSSTRDYNVELTFQVTGKLSLTSTQYSIQADVGTYELVR